MIEMMMRETANLAAAGLVTLGSFNAGAALQGEFSRLGDSVDSYAETASTWAVDTLKGFDRIPAGNSLLLAQGVGKGVEKGSEPVHQQALINNEFNGLPTWGKLLLIGGFLYLGIRLCKVIADSIEQEKIAEANKANAKDLSQEEPMASNPVPAADGVHQILN